MNIDGYRGFVQSYCFLECDKACEKCTVNDRECREKCRASVINLPSASVKEYEGDAEKLRGGGGLEASGNGGATTGNLSFICLLLATLIICRTVCFMYHFEFYIFE